MSQNEKIINDIANELANFRNSAQGVFKSNTTLISLLLNKLRDTREDESTTSEVKEFTDNFLDIILPEVNKCLENMTVYNKSLTDDYSHAIKMLAKLKEDL